MRNMEAATVAKILVQEFISRFGVPKQEMCSLLGITKTRTTPYDQRAHGATYIIGDEVWLHCPAVPGGHCRKFHRPCMVGTIYHCKNHWEHRILSQSNQSPRKRLVVLYNSITQAILPTL